MRAEGVVRHVDDLGRVVIPKELRRILRLREGDTLEMWVNNGSLVMKKYSPIAQLLDECAQEYADSLHETTDHVAIITDMDIVVAISGAPKAKYLKSIDELEDLLKEDIMKTIGDVTQTRKIRLFEDRMYQRVIAPIVCEGDLIGSVILLSQVPKTVIGDLETKLVEAAANFLAKQIEQ